tara:strand:- start:275 stop:589 length:315 start_codon:yes stop_codon:yes gene_type:complete
LEARRSDLLHWVTTLLFVVWLVKVESSFQYFEGSLGSDLRLDSAVVALVASWALGGRPQRRVGLLLAGTVIRLLSLLLLLTPSMSCGVLMLPAFSFGMGLPSPS